MGQKVNPKIFRIGITRTWDSKWFAQGKAYASNLEQDTKVRRYLIKELREAGLVAHGKEGYSVTSLGADLLKRLSDLQAFAVRWTISQSKKK